MKKLEKYKSLQAKFVKFKVKRFVQIPTICHEKQSPLLDCLKSSPPPWMCPHPGSWSLAVALPCLADDTKAIPPWSQGERTLWLRSKFLWFRINMHGNPPAFWNPGQLPLYNSPLDNYIENCFKLSCLESEFHLSKASVATDTL